RSTEYRVLRTGYSNPSPPAPLPGVPGRGERLQQCQEPSAMGNTRGIPFIRLLALLGLAVSTSLLMDHIRPNPHLCGFEWDCEEVLNSRFGSLLGVPLPVIGILGFTAILGVSLFPAGRSGRSLRPLALATGGAGVALLLVQLLILRRFCRFCLLVDGAAIAIGVIELAWRRGVWPIVGVRFPLSWLAGALL